MNFTAFSKKQLKVLTWWCAGSKDRKYDAIICDGAVRSGKTLCMFISFVFWAMGNFDSAQFAICGKTIASLRRNVITPLLPLLGEMGFTYSEKVSRNVIELSLGKIKNTVYLFGGKDESSAALIQGMTLAGVLLDEVALMPRSFVEQALARCSTKNSKLWFNCNPENPLHWFNTEWIKKAESKNCLYIHFRMEDNPSLSPEIIKRYRSLYSGTFYERFVEGKWTAAQGLVYPFFNDKLMVANPPENAEKYCISCDYGTVNPMSMGLWALQDGVWYRTDEYYWSSKIQGSQKTDEEYYDALEALAGDKEIDTVTADPSAVSFMECIRRHGKFRVIPAKNDVADGIRNTSEALKSGKIKICPGCRDIIREFGLYKWDENAVKDVPKKENDHAMDDMRYFVSTVMCENDSPFIVIAQSR